MSYSLVLLSYAVQDLQEAYDWYKTKNKDLALRFYDEVDHYINFIKKNPLSFYIRSNGFRQAPLKIFPFLIIYKVKKNQILIYSIFHTSKNPLRLDDLKNSKTI